MTAGRIIGYEAVRTVEDVTWSSIAGLEIIGEVAMDGMVVAGEVAGLFASVCSTPSSSAPSPA